ncbi:hypothetical protein L211DRAFT_352634 [Terfezia boudieri ATCC MYA-4762]|uniref:Uncharacterized protein n=1 Tax=Terfezia boudieri ATCC MYA-4762 TaxID=1051890 RepID=A0A3N4LH15_9PEZI|nr:hypothetical protein L211DRAFT_352634 [Terfezia boudieri ATCC MYA-4762]
MICFLMIQELFWVSETSRANVQPSTAEIKRKNLHEGKVLWFEWDITNQTLECLSGGDRDSKCKDLFPAFERQCTTTLLYCERDGFSSIPYNPFRDDEAWAHWWSLGFNTGDGNIFTIGRDDETFQRRQIPGNGSGWFRLFRNTQHDNGAVSDKGTPLLTGATSLIWALAAFQFNIGTLSNSLPGALRRDGNLHVLCDEQEGPPGRMSQRALAVELWVRRGEQGTVQAPLLR